MRAFADRLATPRSGRGRLRRQVARGVLALLVLAVLVLLVQAVVSVRALARARSDTTQLQIRLSAGRTADARATLTDLQAATGRARLATAGPVWALAGLLPAVGDDFAAVRTVATAVDRVSRTAVPTGLRLSSAVGRGALGPRHGRFDLSALRRFAPEVRRSAADAAVADEQVARLDARALAWPLSSMVADLQQRLHTTRAAAQATATVIQHGPELLGAGGPRHYLLMVQNNAEIRATGGLPGTLAVLTARAGRVTMGWQGSPGDVGGLARPVLPLRPYERRLYGDRLGTDLRDVSLDPDFPRDAQLARAMVQRRLGVHLDGVVSVDTVTLAYLLQATGPVTVPGGPRLGVGNAVEVLLHEVYQRIPEPRAQDAFFAATAREVFDAVTSRGQQPAVVRALVTATGQGRVLFWSSHPRLQRVVAGTAVAGALTDAPPGTARVDVALNDGTAAKMEYYLRFRTSGTALTCTGSGVQTVRTHTVLRSTAPRDTSTLSGYVTGFGGYARRGHLLLNLRVYGPLGGRIETLHLGGRPVTVTADREQGRQVGAVVVDLPPGRSVAVDAVVRTAPGQGRDPVVGSTPGMELSPARQSVLSACR